MPAPEILGPGLPAGTKFVRPIDIYGISVSVAIPVVNGPIDGVVQQFVNQLPFPRIDIVGFEPCTQDAEAINVDTPDGLTIPRVLYGMELGDDDLRSGGYLVSRRHPWRTPVEHSIRIGVDTVVFAPNFEAAEGSRLRSAA